MNNDLAMEVLDSLVTEWANRFGIGYVSFSWGVEDKLKTNDTPKRTAPKRGFKWIQKFAYRYESHLKLPERATDLSAGYDFFAPCAIYFEPGEMRTISTGIKAFMQDDEVLEIHIRSSLAIKKGLVLANDVGIVDADYFGNKDNDGNILISIVNTSDEKQVIDVNERFAQGIFKKYLTCGDVPSKKRVGGIGSTGC